MNKTDQHGLVILPYAHGFSERVTNVLPGFNIKVAKRQAKIEKRSFRKNRVRTRWNVHADCDCVCVGQTQRALKSRVKEHAKATATLDKTPFVGQIPYTSQSSNRIGECWNCRQVIGVATKTNPWSLAFLAERNAINKFIALPNIY